MAVSGEWMNEALRMRFLRWRFSGWSHARVAFTIMTGVILAQHKVKRFMQRFTTDSSLDANINAALLAFASSQQLALRNIFTKREFFLTSQASLR